MLSEAIKRLAEELSDALVRRYRDRLCEEFADAIARGRTPEAACLWACRRFVRMMVRDVADVF